jgi:hypothetical protein
LCLALDCGHGTCLHVDGALTCICDAGYILEGDRCVEESAVVDAGFPDSGPDGGLDSGLDSGQEADSAADSGDEADADDGNDAAPAEPFGPNLITNPGAETGTLVGWTIIRNGGSGWRAGLPGRSGAFAFTSSYNLCSRSQEIDLIAAGFSEESLDAAPEVIVGEWISKQEFV